MACGPDAGEMQEKAMAAMTLYDKLWASHVVDELPDGSTLLYIDRQLLHEVTSAQAFAALEHTGRAVRRSAAQLAVEDHNVPTTGLEVTDPLAQEQLAALRRNTRRFGIVEHKGFHCLYVVEVL